MKQVRSMILALAVACAVLAAAFSLSALAAADIDVNTPDDAFDGDYTEFKGSDGSVTRVFDNGSVSTKYKDGSTNAVDYQGNQYSEDKEGTVTVRTANGYTATEYKDGRQSLTEPNGTTTVFHTDGTFSEQYGLGVTLDYNADGALTGIGITGSDERIKTDENGFYQNGELTGPDGTKLTITDDGMQFVNKEGTVFNHSDLGNKKTTSIQWKDGSHSESVTDVTWFGAERTENTDFSLTDSKGEQWISNVNTSYDANGVPQYSNNNVVQWMGTDGSTLWMDNNSGAMNYNGKDGTVMVVDNNGNLTEYKDSGNAWNVSYDENGNITSADITYSDGARMVQNPDGTTTFTLPDGTTYTSDGGGNVYKDGEQIKQDGKWLPGHKPNETKPAETTTPDESTNQGAQSGGSGGINASIGDMMGSWSYSDGAITENYTFSQAGESITVVMTATKSDGTTSSPVTFTCSYTFDGKTLVISHEKWHTDMELRLIDKNRLEITSSGTFVLTRK